MEFVGVSVRRAMVPRQTDEPLGGVLWPGASDIMGKKR